MEKEKKRGERMQMVGFRTSSEDRAWLDQQVETVGLPMGEIMRRLLAAGRAGRLQSIIRIGEATTDEG
jgi:hypothetical protein